MARPLDIPLLRESFAVVLEASPHLTRRFYEVFFERYPAVKPMFDSSPKGLQRQEAMLAQALVMVLDQLESPELARTLGLLGGRHVDYGVRDEMYAWVGECLLATLSEAAGKLWTPELEQAWTDAFQAIASMMLAGAHAARLAATTNLKESPRSERPGATA